MRRLRTVLYAALALGFMGQAAIAASEPKFPALTGRVVDAAGILSPQAEAALTSDLAGFEAATKRQVVVATLPDLQGYAIDDFGTRLGRAWGIGEKGKNTGALIIVAPKDRAVRIEVGYGLEGELTDAQASAIIQQLMLPRFRTGDYDGGVGAGTAAVLSALGWKAGPKAPAVQQQSGGIPLGLFGLFFIFFIIMAIQRMRGIGGNSGPWGGRRGWNNRSIGGFGGFGGFGGGGFGGGGSGGFGGGGGSFGGGGASGRW